MLLKGSTEYRLLEAAMSMPQSQPPIDFQNLDASQKLDLITQLWDSLPNSTESIPISEWHRQEL
jgi:hypothetical protein